MNRQIYMTRFTVIPVRNEKSMTNTIYSKNLLIPNNVNKDYIAKSIIDNGADYILALKENQKTLYNEVINTSCKLYVSALFDCFDAAVLGLSMADNMRVELCVLN